MSVPKLKRVVRLDSIKLDKTYFTEEGYLVDHPIVTSCGIFEYNCPDGSVHRELRLPENVFDPESLKSYKGKPVIITHDAGSVDKDNVEDESIGTILSEGYRDGEDVRAEIIIHDTDAMKGCGLRELSLGYSLDLDETPGTWHGQPYDAIQKNIRVNHLALVDKARAGDQARLNIDSRDKLIGGKVMATPKTKKNPKRAAAPKKPARNDSMAAVIARYKARRAKRLDEAENPPAEGLTPEELVQLVRDRRDRRDAEGDPETTEAAMGTIAQQDEDLDTLSWLELTAPLVSKKRFGKLYDQALALLTAHRMKLSGAFDAASEEGGSSIGSLADTLRVASYTEGSTSISFNNGVSLAANDAELTLTGYGTQYLSLRRMVIMPITSAGEAR